jgi:hypothetical protein
LVPRTYRISSLDSQLAQLALSTILFSPEPSGLTVKTSHLSLALASRSLTQPCLLRQKRICDPSGEKRGNQSTASPLVICFTSEPSVFIVNRSWLPTRELDQTIRPGACWPTSFIAAASSGGGASSAPFGGAPETAPQAAEQSAQAQARIEVRRWLMTRSLSEMAD